MGAYDDLLQYAPQGVGTPTQLAPGKNSGPAQDPLSPSANSPINSMPGPSKLPSASAQASAPQASAPQAPPPGGGQYADLMQFAPSASEQAAAAPVSSVTPDGTTPDAAIPESPLSLMERAMMGWVRKPEDQAKYLKQHFDDVKLLADTDGVRFAVKKDGKWFDANPAMSWKWNTAGATAGAAAGAFGAGIPGALIGGIAGGLIAPTVLDVNNLKRAPGALAQMTGEYGLRGEAAAQGGAMGAEAGAAFGPIGAVIGGLGGAALGAAGAEGADLASRSALMDPNAPGAAPYKNPDEIQKELMASAVFGAEGYGLNKGLQFGAAKVASTFGKVLSSFGDTPEGHQAVRRILGFLGAKPEEIEARMMDPQQNAAFDAMRAQDVADANPIKVGRLDRAQEGLSESIHGDVRGALLKQQAAFSALAKDPAIAKAEIDLHSNPAVTPDKGILFQDAAQQLKDSGLVKDNGAINELRKFGPGDKEAADFIMNNVPSSQGLSYADARAHIADIQTMLNQGIFNPNLKRILIDLKDGINSSVASSLEDVKAGSGVSYGDLIDKYGELKKLGEDLDQATAGQKRFSIGKRLLSNNSTPAKDVMESLANAGVDPSKLIKFVQMEGSKNSDSWFTNQRYLKFIPKPSGRMGATIIGAGSAMRGAVSDLGQGLADTDAAQATLPYVHKVVQTMKSLPTDQLRSFLTNPQALDSIGTMIGTAAAGEKQQTQSLLQQAGIQ